MKVLHLASWYPNNTGEQEGDFIQRHLKAIALFNPVHVIHVVKDQHLKTVLSTSKTQEANLNETIIYYKPVKTGFDPVDKLISLRTYMRVFKKAIREHMEEHGRPDLVHLHVAMRAGIAALWMKRRFGIPFVVSEHWSGYYQTDPDNYFERDKLFKHFTRKIIKNANWITGVSLDLTRKISGLFGVSNSTVIYNVVNTYDFYPRQLAAAEFRFIHISDLHPIKNIGGMFRVLKRLKEIRSDWKLTIVGTDDIYYHQLAGKLGITDQIEWTGSIGHNEVPAAIQQSHALLMFSNHENLSCVVCESLCCGLPVIATRVGGMSEIIHETNGRLCSPGDEDDLLHQILHLMDQYSSYNKQKIASAAAELFNERWIGQQFASLYEHESGRSSK